MYYLIQNAGTSFLLAVGLFLVSWFLLKSKLFRVHLVYLVLLAAATAATLLGVDLGESVRGSSLVFLLVVCAWDHYWAKVNLGEEPIKLEKARKMQKRLAIFFTVLALLYVLALMLLDLFDIRFFDGFLEAVDANVLVSAAALMWAYDYFQFRQKTTDGKGYLFYNDKDKNR